MGVIKKLFYEKFLELCAAEKLSPTAAVTIMGMSKGNLARWREGHLPNGRHLHRIAQFFDVPVDALVEKTNKSSTAQQEELLRLTALMTSEEQERLLETARDIVKRNAEKSAAETEAK